MTPGRHYYGCTRGAPGTITGTPGDDVLRGTLGDDIICGMGGDDRIDGGGGYDNLHGGPGDDVIHGGQKPDSITGDDGDDIIVGGPPGETGPGNLDKLQGDGPGGYDDSGNDVLIGGGAPGSSMVMMEGGPGNDVLLPTVGRLRRDALNGGEGADTVVAVNFGTDFIDLSGEFDGTLVLGSTCAVRERMDHRRRGSAGRADCVLPWPKRASGLSPAVSATGTVTTPIRGSRSAEVEVDFPAGRSLATLPVATWRAIQRDQASLTEDVCVCDPLYDERPAGPHPWDFAKSPIWGPPAKPASPG